LDLEFADMKTIMDMALEAGFTERELIRAVDSITRFAALVRADEREACAMVCERDDSMRWSGAAAAIRARGNT
jgi:hypothetical protein